ncbi:MAG: tetratricopeptide repeat protein, partial [Terrimicrobiaceae bacterium]
LHASGYLPGDQEMGHCRSSCQTSCESGPGKPGAWINLAYSVRRAENIGQAEAVLLKARALHPEDASIAFNLACYASATGRMKKAKVRLRQAIYLDKDIRLVALDDEDLRPLWDWIGGVK